MLSVKERPNRKFYFFLPHLFISCQTQPQGNVLDSWYRLRFELVLNFSSHLSQMAAPKLLLGTVNNLNAQKL